MQMAAAASLSLPSTTALVAALGQPQSTRYRHGTAPQLQQQQQLVIAASANSSTVLLSTSTPASSCLNSCSHGAFSQFSKASISDRTTALHALRVFSTADSAVGQKVEKWLLQPIGDGDCRHLDEAVPLPEAFELSVDAATVGRVSERADIVIPIATVSGLHARLEKKGGTLYVADLDSTNGTYINDRQLKPGVITPVPPGSRITFGDDHLAAFKFSKVEVEAISSTLDVEVPLSDVEASTSDVKVS